MINSLELNNEGEQPKSNSMQSKCTSKHPTSNSKQPDNERRAKD